MISIISLFDGVLRDRAEEAKVVKGTIYIIGTHRSYPMAHYAIVDADSSAFEVRGARWVNGAWEAYPTPMPMIDVGSENYLVVLARQADALEAKGDLLGAMNIRLSLGGK